MNEQEFLKYMKEKLEIAIKENIQELESVLERSLTNNEKTYYVYGFEKGANKTLEAISKIFNDIFTEEEAKCE